MPFSHTCTQLSSQAFQPAHSYSMSLRHKLKASNSDRELRGTHKLWSGTKPANFTFFFMTPSQMHTQFGFGYLHTLRDSKIFTHLGKQNKGASPTYIQTALSLWKHSIHQPRYFNDRSRPPNCPDASLSAQNSRNTAPCLAMCHPPKITIQSHQPRAIATEEIAQPV